MQLNVIGIRRRMCTPCAGLFSKFLILIEGHWCCVIDGNHSHALISFFFRCDSGHAAPLSPQNGKVSVALGAHYMEVVSSPIQK